MILTEIAPGQVWRHVGFEDQHGSIAGTGLRVRVLRHHERGGWVCDYPDLKKHPETRYPYNAFERGYAMIEVPA